jgi:hypothetical protein
MLLVIVANFCVLGYCRLNLTDIQYDYVEDKSLLEKTQDITIWVVPTTLSVLTAICWGFALRYFRKSLVVINKKTNKCYMVLHISIMILRVP